MNLKFLCFIVVAVNMELVCVGYFVLVLIALSLRRIFAYSRGRLRLIPAGVHVLSILVPTPRGYSDSERVILPHPAC